MSKNSTMYRYQIYDHIIDGDREYGKKRYGDAIISYKEIEDIITVKWKLDENEKADAYNDLNYAQYRIGWCYFWLSDFDSAIKYVDKALKHTIDYRNYWLRGIINFAQKKYQAAIHDLIFATQISDDKDFSCEEIIGGAYKNLGEYNKAIPFYLSYIRKKQGEYTTILPYDSLISCYEKTGDITQAKYYYNEALNELFCFSNEDNYKELIKSHEHLRISINKPHSLYNESNTNENNTANNIDSNSECSLQDLLNELNDLIGLSSVKNDVNSLINLIKINKVRAQRGFQQVPTSMHLVFSGNPGTGKTTVARIISKIYKKLGILSKGQLIEVDRSKLVAGYVGQTAIQTQEIIQEAIGGILFIDEAYTLSSSNNSNDFGQEAIDVILKAMEDNRDNLIVIVAGYPDLMKDFLNSNPGLISRFNKFINFDDYSAMELTEIFDKLCQKSGYSIDSYTKSTLFDYISNKYKHRDKNFANAREIRNLFEKSITNQANRLALNSNITNHELMTLTIDDII